MKGGIVHDEQGARLKLLEQLFFEVVIEYEGIEVPLKKQWGEESFSLGCGRDEVGSRSAASSHAVKRFFGKFSLCTSLTVPSSAADADYPETEEDLSNGDCVGSGFDGT